MTTIVLPDQDDLEFFNEIVNSTNINNQNIDVIENIEIEEDEEDYTDEELIEETEEEIEEPSVEESKETIIKTVTKFNLKEELYKCLKDFYGPENTIIINNSIIITIPKLKVKNKYGFLYIFNNFKVKVNIENNEIQSIHQVVDSNFGELDCHSHINKNDGKFCLGSGDLKMTICEINMSCKDSKLKSFIESCESFPFILQSYLEWEDLDTGPYRRLYLQYFNKVEENNYKIYFNSFIDIDFLLLIIKNESIHNYLKSVEKLNSYFIGQKMYIRKLDIKMDEELKEYYNTFLNKTNSVPDYIELAIKEIFINIIEDLKINLKIKKYAEQTKSNNN